MKVIFAHRNDAHKINGIPQTIVEIVGGRITVRLSTTGKKVDMKVADVTEFDGEIDFSNGNDERVAVSSNDTSPAPEPKAEPAPLFDTPAEEAPMDTEALPAPEEAEESPVAEAKASKGKK